jgi:hypothetical protein
MSTIALQALMPMQRQQRARLGRAAKSKGTLEIPEDSSDDRNDGTEDIETGMGVEESYVASPRPIKKSKRSALSTTQKSISYPRRQTERAGKASRSGGAMKSKGTSRPSPPTPTSRSVSAAKTSSLQQRKQLGSDRATRVYSKRGGQVNDGAGSPSAEEDEKENRPSASFGSSSRQAPSKRGKPTSGKTATDARDNDDGQVETGRGRSRATSHAEMDPLRDEQAKLVEKFKEVDEWEMEFETLDADSSFDLLF